MNNCARTGVFRKISTYVEIRALTTFIFSNLIRAKSNPIIIAKTNEDKVIVTVVMDPKSKGVPNSETLFNNSVNIKF